MCQGILFLPQHVLNRMLVLLPQLSFEAPKLPADLPQMRAMLPRLCFPELIKSLAEKGVEDMLARGSWTGCPSSSSLIRYKTCAPGLTRCRPLGRLLPHFLLCDSNDAF